MKLEALTLGTPVTRGALALFPLNSTTTAAPGPPVYICGPTAFDNGLVAVGEHGSGATVPELEVVVTGNTPVLLLEGETIIGAKQNRTLNVSVLCAPGVTVVPVSCLEAGRWGLPEWSARSPRHSPSGLWARKTEGVMRAARSGDSRLRSDQAAVWAEVDSYASDFQVASPTRSMEDVHVAAGDRVEELTTGLDCPADARGVLVAVGGESRSLDLFDCHDTLATYWPSLAAGAGLDALGAAAAEPMIEQVEAFLADVVASDESELATVGVGTTSALEGSRVVGTGLRWNDTLVHLAAFRVDDATDRPRRPPIRRSPRRPVY